MDFLIFVVGKQHGEHVFFWGPSSALNLGTGNMTPWFVFGKIKQPEPSAAWSQIARTCEVEVSAMKLMSPCVLESDPHHPGHHPWSYRSADSLIF